jgi:starvation-inducible DNA-binding protein
MANEIVKTDTGIAEAQKPQIIDGLCKLLAESQMLYLKTQSFHWNVTGPMFYALHTMFETQYRNLSGAVDEIAERIRALGAFAPGSFAQFTKISGIAESTSPVNAREMISQLLEAQNTVIKTCRSVLPIAEKAYDEVTSDLLIQRMNQHEKFAWMLRSTLQD